MEWLNNFVFLWQNFIQITWQQGVMYLVGALLIYLAIKKGLEPALLLPMGFGAILVNLPNTGVVNWEMPGVGEVNGILQWLFMSGGNRELSGSNYIYRGVFPVRYCSGNGIYTGAFKAA